MKGTRFYKLIIAVLIIINLGTLAFIAFGKPPHPPKPGEGPLLSETIGLTGDSKTKVDALEKIHHQDKHILMQKDRDLHEQLFSKVGSGESPEEIYAELNNNKSEIERMTFEFFNDVSAYCSKEQLIALKKFINEAMVNMGHRPPPPHQK